MHQPGLGKKRKEKRTGLTLRETVSGLPRGRCTTSSFLTRHGCLGRVLQLIILSTSDLAHGLERDGSVAYGRVVAVEAGKGVAFFGIHAVRNEVGELRALRRVRRVSF